MSKWLKTISPQNFRTVSYPEYIKLDREIRKTVNAMGVGITAKWGSVTGDIIDQVDLTGLLLEKQNILLSGANIKTVNGNDILGSGNISISTTYTHLKFIQSLNDLPTPVLGVITLAANTGYHFTTTVDLNGNRFFCESNVSLIGTSSEISYITSTGLITPLITSNNTITIVDITFSSAIVLDINALGNFAQLNWRSVNFLNCNNIGTIQNVTNFIYNSGAFINSSGLVFSGTISTIALTGCSIIPGTGTAITLNSNAIILSRFRIIYSSIVVNNGSTGINIDALATIPIEGFILDTVNFISVGTFLTGVDSTSNKALFNYCKGIINSTVFGQMYMLNNLTATVVTAANTFYKVLGITTPSLDNSKYTHSNNRLTNGASIIRRYYASVTLSFTAGNNNVCQFAFFDSRTGTIISSSIIKSTANSAGKSENISLQTILTHSDTNFIEVWCLNESSATNIVVNQMNVIIIER